MDKKDLRKKLSRLQSRAYNLQIDISDLVRELDKDKKMKCLIQTK